MCTHTYIYIYMNMILFFKDFLRVLGGCSHFTFAPSIPGPPNFWAAACAGATPLREWVLWFTKFTIFYYSMVATTRMWVQMQP